MNFVLLTLLLALSTYIPRVIPAVFISSLRFSKKARIFLKLLPYTVMASLIFPGILNTDPDHISIGLAGGAAAVLCSWFRLPVVVSILVAVGVDLLLYLLVF